MMARCEFHEYGIFLLETERKNWDENKCMRKSSPAAKSKLSASSSLGAETQKLPVLKECGRTACWCLSVLQFAVWEGRKTKQYYSFCYFCLFLLLPVAFLWFITLSDLARNVD